MPVCATKFHGELEYQQEQVLQVPAGLFGFADERQFLLLEIPSMRPLVFVQSIGEPSLCFLTLPAQVVQADFRLKLSAADLKDLGFATQKGPRMGVELLCLALLNVAERDGTTANLQAPLVIDIARHRGKQVIVDGAYSHRHHFTPRLETAC